MYSIIVCHSLLATFIFSSYFKQIEDYTKISFWKAGTRVAPNLGINCLVVFDNNITSKNLITVNELINN